MKPSRANGEEGCAVRRWSFLLILGALLLSGTLKVGLLTNSYAQVTLPIPGVDWCLCDGRTLSGISEASIDFAFSFDSLVHADADVIAATCPNLLGCSNRNGALRFCITRTSESTRPLLTKVEKILASSVGWNNLYLDERSVSAWITLGLLTLWTGRKHLARVVKQIFTKRQTNESPSDTKNRCNIERLFYLC
jgi:hypothetical protein